MMQFRRTTLITVGCGAALVGLGLSRKLNAPVGLLWLVFAPLLLLLRRKNLSSLILVVLLGLGLGLWRGGTYMQKLNELKAFTGHKVTIQATATSDSIYSKASQIEFTANNATLLQGPALQKDLAGSFKISGFGTPMVYRGDRVQISGKLYPMRGANQGRIAYAQLTRVGFDDSWMNKFTRRFSAGMQSALPEPQASFGLGLLIGQRSTLPQELTNQLVMVGLVHIVAVSGYNLTILVRASSRLKLKSKYQQLILSLTLIVAFILMTGFSASIVRAAIVSILGLWAWYYGRDLRPVLLITFTAALTGLFNPFYVWGDLGWYLSFLAFFGVLVIAPAISARLFKNEPKLLTSVVIETLSAEIMTLPLIMMTFGQLSLIGLVANAMIGPLVPLAMLLSAAAATAGMVFAPIAGWLAWPARLLLTYMLDVVHLLADIPSIFLQRSVNTYQMLAFYIFVVLITLGLRKHQTRIKEKTPLLVKSAG
jgi:competence protein ComEC